MITTKVWPGRDPSGEWYWAEPGQLRGQVEENLRQLGRDHLDVVNLRIPRSAEGGSIAEHFAALAALRAAGLIRHLGISGISAQQLAEARAIAPVVCVQNRAKAAVLRGHGICGAYRVRRADPVDLGWRGRDGSSGGSGCSRSAGPDGWPGTLGIPRSWYPAASARTSTPMRT